MTISEDPRLAATQQPVASRPGSPELSVVFASSGPVSHLASWLAVLVPRCLSSGAELIVARADRWHAIADLAAAYPSARILAAPPDSPLATLRSAGFGASSGDVIAILDDSEQRTQVGGRVVDALRDRCGAKPDRPARTRSAAPQPTWPEILQNQDAAAALRARPPRPRSADAIASIAVPAHPYLSVVVPVHQGGDVLEQALEALRRSDLPRACWELIVVDDASTDDSASRAARHADIIVRLPGRPHGPAYARNRGFDFARGECVVFIAADVCVRHDCLTQFALIFAREPEVSAVFGTVDVSPAQGGLVSQYRNLLTHYYHFESPGAAETFWADCGAIRSDVFAAAGRFDEWHFPRRQVEDSELGLRLNQLGRRIVLRPEIRATTLQRWTLRSLIGTNLHDRTVPWMRIMQKPRGTSARSSGRLRRIRRSNTLLIWCAVVASLLALATGTWVPLAMAGVAVALALVNNREQYRFLARKRSLGFALASVPLDLLSYVVNGTAVAYGLLLREMLGPPPPDPTVEAFAEVGVEMWPPVPARRPSVATDAIPTGKQPHGG